MNCILSKIKKAIDKIHDNLPVVLLVATALLVLLGAFSLWCLCNKGLSLVLFIASGVTHGIFYGLKNDWIFHYPHAQDGRFDKTKTEFLQSKKVTNASTEENFSINPFTKALYINRHAEANTLWVHLVSSVTGSIALYLLINRLYILNLYLSFENFQFSDLVIFLVALLGYTGLLPMTLWFFANSGKLLENLIKQK